ncbi:hypothetical protein JNW90_26135 [Micromonospora sp. STR1s_5]|nr:hypothetical protein [Micromonospora sp. STR1s_5]
MSVQLGCRSPLVLAKLGFDLRSQLQGTLSSPLPDPVQRLADEVDGYVEWRDVGAPPSDEGARASAGDLWQDLVEADQPFTCR